jgi:hypothetical protein
MTASAVIAGLAGLLAVEVVGAPAPTEAPRPPTADPGERAEALLLGGAVNRFVAKQLPMTFAVRGDHDAGIGAEDLTLVDARFCGGKDLTHGRFVGVLRLGGATTPLPALEARDCRRKLDEAAHRIGAASDAGALAVVELVAEWVPTELRVNVGDVATSGDGSRALARTLARAKTAGPLTTIDTSGLRLETERGSSLTFDLALSFPKGEAVLAGLTVACAGCVPVARAPFVSASGAPPDSDGVVGATLRFANRIAALYAEDGPLVLDLNGQSVEIRGVQITGSEGTLAVRGRATSREIGESAQVRIESTGTDLKLGEVRADVESEDCGALSGGAAIRCRVRNAARGPAASAIASALTSRYRGTLLRELTAPPPFSFDLGGRRMTLRLTPTRASATAGGLVIYGKAEVE